MCMPSMFEALPRGSRYSHLDAAHDACLILVLDKICLVQQDHVRKGYLLHKLRRTSKKVPS